MKYFLLFLISFTIHAQDEIKLWQKLNAVGTCATLENHTIYMEEKDCKNAHGECALLTVNCAYAKLAQREVDDLEKPIFEVVETSCEESEDQSQVCTETKLIGYEKKTEYYTEIDGAKKLAYDAQVINERLFRIQKEKAECGHDVVLFVGAINQTKPNLTAEQVREVTNRTREVSDDLKDGALELAFIGAMSLDLTGTILDNNDKQVILGKIQECINRFK